MKRLWAAFLLTLLIIIPGRTSAQTQDNQNIVRAGGMDVSVRIGGTIQPRIAYSFNRDNEEYQDQLGFGIRRLRLTMHTEIEDRILLFTQLEGAAPAGMRFMDLRLGYRFSDALLIQTGRFIGAQPRGFAITLQNEIDAIERAAIAIVWAAQTIGSDGRSYGIESIMRYSGWELRSFIHNGYNQDNYRSLIDDEHFITAGATTMPAIGISFNHHPGFLKGLEAGIYGGYNPSRNPNTELDGIGRRYSDYSAHVYWGSVPGSQPIRIKADLIGIQFENNDPLEINKPPRQSDFLGGSLFGSWMPHKTVETFIRIERYGNYTESGNQFRDFLTTGITYSRSALFDNAFRNQRITVAYSNRYISTMTESVRHSIILQVQVVF